MTTNLSIFPVLFLSLLLLCNPQKAFGKENVSTQQDTLKAFTLPTLPDMLTTPAQRADYLVKHYWDNMDFADTNYIHHPEITEQAWVDYCDLMNHVPLDVVRSAMKATIIKAGTNKKMFDYITDLADKYLYDPNSPMRNEEFYIPVLEAMITSPILDDVEKIRPRARLELAQKNRPGTKATDFTYTLASGTKGNLYQLPSGYTLLFFNNPECHACSETIEELKNSVLITQLLADKKLQILSVYPDEEIDEWKKHLNEFPAEWINSYDKEQILRGQNVYDLKAIPTLYLLDRNKVVLLKDVSLPIIETYLAAHS